MNSSKARLAVQIIGIAVAYFVAARLGFLMAFVAEQVSSVWAPSGIAVAVVLLSPHAAWGVWLGALAANATTTAPLWTAVLIATGNTLEALAASWMLRRVSGFDPTLRRMKDVVALIGLGSAAATVASATIGVSTLCVAGVQPWSSFGTLWAVWWLGDAIGVLIVAPVILMAARARQVMPRRVVVETALLLLSAAGATELVFGDRVAVSIRSHPLEFVVFPFEMWAAIRLGLPGTSAVILVTSALSVWNTELGRGPFGEYPVHQSLILLETFLAVLAVSGLLLAAATEERQTSNRRRFADYGVAEILAEARTTEEAAPHILQAICRNLEWDVGAIWTLDDQKQELRCLAVRSVIPGDAQTFVEATAARAFVRGVGLPGRVWETAAPAWIVDVVKDENFPRAPAAARDGLHGALAFPIKLGSNVLGVAEIFSRTPQVPDADLLDTMAGIGYRLGNFIQRLDAEEERQRLLMRELHARKEAEEANRAKDEFLATLSHELRTPLNAIAGWSRMLLDGNVGASGTRHALEIIDRNAKAQTQLIGDLLDVSRIISGGLRLEPRPIDLGTVLGAAADAVKPAADAKRIDLVLQIAPGQRVEGDPVRLQQIIWNLLSNAVKFTEPGGSVVLSSVGLADGGVEVQVTDTGNGIPADLLPFVFDRFRQGDASATRRHGGLGLGLAIVRHLVELHGGTVTAQSGGKGHGATFTVRLPTVARRA